MSETLGKVGPQQPRIGRRLGEMGEPDLRRAAARERRRSGEALEEHAPERVDVALPRRLPALDQLRREVVRRAEELALGGQPRRVRAARQPEVRQSRSSLAVEEHVRGLHVPVQDSALVKGIEPAPELRGEVDGLVDAERPEQAQPESERAAGVVRHREELDVP